MGGRGLVSAYALREQLCNPNHKFCEASVGFVHTVLGHTLGMQHKNMSFLLTRFGFPGATYARISKGMAWLRSRPQHGQADPLAVQTMKSTGKDSHWLWGLLEHLQTRPAQEEAEASRSERADGDGDENGNGRSEGESDRDSDDDDSESSANDDDDADSDRGDDREGNEEERPGVEDQEDEDGDEENEEHDDEAGDWDLPPSPGPGIVGRR